MIVIVEGLGMNIASLEFALNRLGAKFKVSKKPRDLRDAQGVIFPGVSSAQRAMKQINDNNLMEELRNLTQPVLGICSGMQILFNKSEEGEVACLDLFDQSIHKLNSMGNPLPHMGWNALVTLKADPLLEGINTGSYVYYVHSYAADINSYTLASSCYGQPFSAIVIKDNWIGMQFHPERSGAVGKQLLANFLKKCEI